MRRPQALRRRCISARRVGGLRPLLLATLLASGCVHADHAIVLHPQVAVLGVWDFPAVRQADNGLDMRTPPLQEQIAQAAARLARFRPDAIVLMRAPEVVEARADNWRRGNRALAEDGVEQIGFAVAAQAGLERISGIGRMIPANTDAVVAWQGGHLALSAPKVRPPIGIAEASAMLAIQLRWHPVSENLRGFNPHLTGEPVAADVWPLLALGDADEQPGADAVAAQIRQTLLWCARIVQQVSRQHSAHRTLVVADLHQTDGLRWCLARAPRVQLVAIGDYLGEMDPEQHRQRQLRRQRHARRRGRQRDGHPP